MAQGGGCRLLPHKIFAIGPKDRWAEWQPQSPKEGCRPVLPGFPGEGALGGWERLKAKVGIGTITPKETAREYARPTGSRGSVRFRSVFFKGGGK
jgi:hypothetical protein